MYVVAFLAPVYELDQALDNPWLDTIGMKQNVSHPDRPEIKVLSSPIRIDGERLPSRAAPLLGADSTAILQELGYDLDVIADMRQAGVI